MNDLTCQEIDESLAAYAVDALDRDESVAVEHHLAECRQHDAELGDFRSVTDRLPAMLDSVETSGRLRNSLLDAFDSAVGAPAPAEPMGATPQPPQPPRQPKRGTFAMPSFGYALAAALLVVAVGLGAWGISRGDDAPPGGVVVRTIEGSDHRVDFVYVPERQLALLSLELPQLSADRAYQVWQITDGGPVSMGVMAANTVTAMEIDLSDASAIAISIEPAGGSTSPTTTPILVSEI
ncbi:MAG: hypothetical protein GEU75_14605 [Dehalococcoidia bacterium]|nr:hypothetical protein [Dehalococcoidia bacterium]